LRDAETLSGVNTSTQPEYLRNYVPKYEPTTGVLLTAWLGDVLIDGDVIHTPVGDMPRNRTRWQVGETIPQPGRVPTWAIACAVILFFCMGPFSLLFLLVKDAGGQMTAVHLTDGRARYTTTAFTVDQNGYRLIHQTVEWAEQALPERRAIGG